MKNALCVQKMQEYFQFEIKINLGVILVYLRYNITMMCIFFFDQTSFRQPTLWLHYVCYTLGIAAVCTSFNIFSYKAVIGRDPNQSPNQQQADALRVTPRSQIQIYRLVNSSLTLWALPQECVVSNRICFSPSRLTKLVLILKFFILISAESCL